MPWMNIYCIIHYFVEEGQNEFRKMIYFHSEIGRLGLVVNLLTLVDFSALYAKGSKMGKKTLFTCLFSKVCMPVTQEDILMSL